MIMIDSDGSNLKRNHIASSVVG